jgi:plasmid stability protein
MPVTLTIKQVPDELAERLRAQAARNHRSLQGELMHTLETVIAAHDYGKASAALQSTAPARSLDRSSPADQAPGDLLTRLDSIVAGSRWGEAPLLGRDQANDRNLIREIDHLLQERQADYRR